MRGLGNADRALELLQEAQHIQANPQYKGTAHDRALLQFHLGMTYHDMRELEVGKEYYAQALSFVPSDDANLEFRNQIEFRFAWLLAESGDLQRSVDMFSKIKQDRLQVWGPMHPKTQTVELALILAELSRKDPKSTLNRIEEIVSKTP